MADIFLSYARADRDKAETVAAALRASGYSVFFDVSLEPGDSWDRRIEAELSQAKRVVVLWSPASVGRQWVRNEAREGAARGVLRPVLLARCEIPVEFSHIQAADLRGWSGATEHPGWRDLLRALATNSAAPAPSKPQRTSGTVIRVVAAVLVVAAALTAVWLGTREDPASSAAETPAPASTASAPDVDAFSLEKLDPSVRVAVSAARATAITAREKAEEARRAAEEGERAALAALEGQPGTTIYANAATTFRGHGAEYRIEGYAVAESGDDPYAGILLAFEGHPGRHAGRFAGVMEIGVSEMKRGAYTGRYEGESPQGRMDRRYAGVWTHETHTYEGEVSGDAIRRGFGVATFKDGTRWEGEWKDGFLLLGVEWTADGRVRQAGKYEAGALTEPAGRQNEQPD